MTEAEAAAALAAMSAPNRSDVETVMTAPNKHIAYARMCHDRSWSGAWALYVWEIVQSAADDDIPF
jgi:hypothetical protein